MINQNTEPIDVSVQFAAMADHGLFFYPDHIDRMSKEDCLTLAAEMFKAFLPPSRPGAYVMNDDEVRLKFFDLIRDNNRLNDRIKKLIEAGDAMDSFIENGDGAGRGLAYVQEDWRKIINEK